MQPVAMVWLHSLDRCVKCRKSRAPLCTKWPPEDEVKSAKTSPFITACVLLCDLYMNMNSGHSSALVSGILHLSRWDLAAPLLSCPASALHQPRSASCIKAASAEEEVAHIKGGEPPEMKPCVLGGRGRSPLNLPVPDLRDKASISEHQNTRKQRERRSLPPSVSHRGPS